MTGVPAVSPVCPPAAGHHSVYGLLPAPAAAADQQGATRVCQSSSTGLEDWNNTLSYSNGQHQQLMWGRED